MSDDSRMSDGSEAPCTNKIPLLIDNVHFKLEMVAEKRFQGTCLLCPSDWVPTKPNQKDPKTVKGHLGVNSNLLRHLKTHHAQAHDTYRAQQDRKRKLESLPPTVKKKYHSKEEVNKAIANFVIESSQPISVVEHPAFKTLVTVLSGTQQ